VIQLELAKEPPGKLLRVLSPAERVPTKATCYEEFFDREEPCPGCPAVSAELNGRVRQGIAEPAPGLPMRMVVAEPKGKSRVLVTSVALSDQQLSALSEARLERLARRAGLSAREQEVLQLLLFGRSLDEIAQLLGISTRTVRFHQGNLLDKLGADSRSDLVRLLL
jgi:DNA-binding CsgD family transcriptional regulator